MLDEGVTRLTLCRPRSWDLVGSILSCSTGFSASVPTGRLVITAWAIVVAWSWLLAPLSALLFPAGRVGPELGQPQPLLPSSHHLGDLTVTDQTLK